MKLTQSILFLAAATITATLSTHAQVKTAAASPDSELKQVVGLTEFTIKYSRPSVKDREIYGGLVPYEKLWRTGANATTKISFDTEIEFGGKKVPAGDYVLFSIPNADEWTVILYGDTSVRNAGLYDQKDDVTRITVKPLTLANPVESFTIGFDTLRDTSATLFIDWANTRVPVEIEIDTVALTLSSIESAMEGVFANNQLHALLYPTNPTPVSLIIREPGSPQGVSPLNIANLTGFPDLVIPGGMSPRGLPVTFSLMGRAFTEGRLLSYAYDYEQATKAIRLPVNTPALPSDQLLK